MEELLKLFLNQKDGQTDISSLIPLFMNLMQNNEKKDTAVTASDPSIILYEMYH